MWAEATFVSQTGDYSYLSPPLELSAFPLSGHQLGASG